MVNPADRLSPTSLDLRPRAAKLLLKLLKLTGKSERKVAAVFGVTPTACQTAVLYLRAGAPEVPVWLFSTTQPLPETAALCERVHVNRNSVALLFHAEVRLWRRWVAISVGTWTGERGQWPLKLAPFLIPPFRALLLNSHQDFFRGTLAKVLIHGYRRLRDVAHSAWRRTQDVGSACWLLVSYHIWRSGPCTRVKDELSSLSLLVAASVLRCCSYPHRNWFGQLHGDEALSVPYTPVGGDGLLPFTQDEPHWDGPALERLLLSSDARWVLWQDGSSTGGTVDDMLPLYQDDRTFAVSRQPHYRAWVPMLLPTAPFRTLQPGEASQVLAPLSATILVDRRKLLALGIPHCSLTGTAWLLLFWKAAAAGWRSYSMGQRGPLSQLSDFPLEETAFIYRVLTNTALRRLCPSEPDLARGNVAFVPAGQFPPRPDSGRLKVLLVSPFLPYPLSHGGAVRIYNLCRVLADRVDFILVAIRETQDVIEYAKLREVFREVYVADLDEPASLDEQLPEQVRHHQSRSLRALIADLAARWKPDLLQIEYTHMAGFRDCAPGIPAILVEHDLTFSLYRQLLENQPSDAARREYERWLAFERRWLGAYDAVWTMSGDDRACAIREGSHPSRTFTVPNGVDTVRFAPCGAPASSLSDSPEVFYVGSFRHLPNILGFEKLCREIMPRVWERFPNTRLRAVAGPRRELFSRKFSRQDLLQGLDRRIEIHGFVEDLRPLYARASVVVAPLEVSAGTNIKVLEAMACGKAIVTTPAGCAGLSLQNGRDALIRADSVDFARSVCDLLADAEIRSRVATQARRTAEDRFSWMAIQADAYRSYIALAAPWRARHRDTLLLQTADHVER